MMRNHTKIAVSIGFFLFTSLVFGQWQNNGTDIVYTTDKVGIGTSTPQNSLTVVGGASFKETAAQGSGVEIFLGYNDNGGGFHPNDFAFFQAFDHDNPSVQPPMFFGPSVLIGTLKEDPQFALSVDGSIKTREIVVTDTGWADFVFAEDYPLMPLAELEKKIQAQGHLPNIPSAEEVRRNGVGLAEMQVKLLQKIEELTLYVIDLQKENLTLKARMDGLETER